MLKIVYTTQFKKDYKKLNKTGYDLTKINHVINLLANNEKLSDKYKDHKLQGKFSQYRECHIEPDWLLIYEIDNGILVLMLYRVGSHSELF